LIGNIIYYYYIKKTKQKTLDLEAKIKLLEKQKDRAEYLAERTDKKAIIFDIPVDLADQEVYLVKLSSHQNSKNKNP